MNSNGSTRAVALGGVLAALGVSIMCLGSITGIATYVSPMICLLLLQAVLNVGGKRVAWAWYGAVAVLSLLLVTDREAAWMFVFLGYYPIVKPYLDRKKLALLWKGLLFNGCILVMYWLLLRIFGLEDLAREWKELGSFFIGLLLLLGNFTFFLLDKLLSKPFFQRLGRYGK